MLLEFWQRVPTHLTHYYTEIERILNAVRNTTRKTNPDYDLVIKRLYLYYDMKVVTFGIGRDKNLIIQFIVFIQRYTQQLPIYQIEIVSVPIIDLNMQAHPYTHLHIDRLFIALNSKTYITIRLQ